MSGDESGYGYKGGKETGKAAGVPYVKEEEMSEEEFERMMENRYKPGSALVTYAEDDHKSSVDHIYVPSDKDATLWKVKCMVDVFIIGVALYLYNLITVAVSLWIYWLFASISL